MGYDLYSDAILEAKKLRTMAEEAAKNRIIEAVTPRIRRLIENQLLAESEEELLDAVEDIEMADDIELPDEDSSLDPGAGDLIGDEPAAMPSAEPVVDVAPPAAELGGDGGSKISIGPDGEIEIEVGDLNIEIEKSDDDEEGLILDEPVAEALSSALNRLDERRLLTKQVNVIHEKIDFLKNALELAKRDGSNVQKRSVSNIFEALARKVVSLKRQAIISERNGVSVNEEIDKLDIIIEEMDTMSRRNTRNSRSIFDFLFEDSVGEAMHELEEGEGGGEEEAADVDVDAASTALEDLGDALGLEVEVGGEEGGEEDLDAEDEDLEADEEVELPEADMAELEEADMEEVYEIDEAALRRELTRLRRLNESDPVDGSGDSSFGGGEAGDEPFIEVDEDDLLNALADELGDAPVPKVGAGAGEAAPAVAAESRRHNRAANRQLKEYKKVVHALKGQLSEMNLFNAKLLYANKLMQNRDLTPRQQRAIVEALDNANTLREAKLLYKSLTTSLNKKRGNSGRLSEGVVRARGSSSSPTRTAQPVQSGVGEKDRWAVLAGLEN